MQYIGLLIHMHCNNDVSDLSSLETKFLDISPLSDCAFYYWPNLEIKFLDFLAGPGRFFWLLIKLYLLTNVQRTTESKTAFVRVLLSDLSVG